MNKVGGGKQKQNTDRRETSPIALTQPISCHSISNLLVSPTHYKRALKVVNEKERKYKWKSGRKK